MNPIRSPLYLGCRREKELGHFVFRPDGTKDHSSRLECLDGLFPPAGQQIEGIASLCHLSIGTVLAFWDRSVDHRGGSHSTFFLPGRLSFDEALAMARKHFWWVFDRLPFDVAAQLEQAGKEGA